MSAFVEKARRLHASIHNILLHDWDVIGVSGIAQAQDEYNAYVGEVYRLLTRRVTWQEIFNYLWWVETEHMGLRGNRQKTEAIARQLHSLIGDTQSEP